MWCPGAISFRLRRLGVAALAVAASACFSPRYEHGIECSEAGTCPPGLFCNVATNRCGDEEAGSDAAGVDAWSATTLSADGGMADAASLCAEPADPCAPGGRCAGTREDYTCLCDAGYSPNGVTCEPDSLNSPILVGAGGPDTPRQWSDGIYAASCQDYRYPQAPYRYEGAIGDGYYQIAPSRGTLAVVYCDMTTAGGGWTGIDPGAAVELGGVTETVYSTGVTRCRVRDGMFEAFYVGPTGTDELVCRYDIPLGFSVDTVRVLSDAQGQPPEHVVTLAPVLGPGHVLDISDLASAMWGARAPMLRGDFGIGTAAHPGPVLSLGRAFGAETKVDSMANVRWPASASMATTSDSTLRLEYRDSDTEEEGVRWIAGRIFVRHEASLPQ